MFATRSYQKELLDQPGIPFEDIRQNMQELDVINRRLGGHGLNLAAIKKLLPRKLDEPLRILEIGCGDGNNLRQIAEWSKRNNIAMKLSGTDLNKECIDYARSISANEGIEFTCNDYRELAFTKQPHIIFSSLFCHHFTDTEVIEIIKWKHQHSMVGFFINDLHRHPLAYHSIRLVTRLFSKSYLVKNDAPLSVARSFRKEEWVDFFSKAKIPDYHISWRWAFRWLITAEK